MPLHYDGEVQIVKVNMGPYDNNGYIIIDPSTGEGVIVDAPTEAEKLLAEVGDTKIKGILITHGHRDHTLGWDEMRDGTPGVPVYVHPDDAYMMPAPAELRVNDGDVIEVGNTKLHIMHTPGHTAGAICILTGNHLFSGDTLFPGGPGRTGSPELFLQVKDSIERKLMPLPDDTQVYPGHGLDTTIGEARQQIQTFDSKPHSADLCGDVSWLGG